MLYSTFIFTWLLGNLKHLQFFRSIRPSSRIFDVSTDRYLRLKTCVVKRLDVNSFSILPILIRFCGAYICIFLLSLTVIWSSLFDRCDIAYYSSISRKQTFCPAICNCVGLYEYGYISVMMLHPFHCSLGTAMANMHCIPSARKMASYRYTMREKNTPTIQAYTVNALIQVQHRTNGNTGL